MAVRKRLNELMQFSKKRLKKFVIASPAERGAAIPFMEGIARSVQ